MTITELRPCYVVGAALMIAACSPQAASEPPTSATSGAQVVAGAPSTHPVSGLEVVPVTLTLEGGEHIIDAELAATPQAQARGLMFRTEMGADEGMIFPYENAHVLSFWMKNTVIPLDIIFIGPDQRVINVAANAVPYSLTPVTAEGVASAVLELNGGRAAELGIGPGTKIDW